MITQDDINTAKKLATELNLIGARVVIETDPDELLEVCNGVGPAWFPRNLRNLIDKFSWVQKINSIFHDMLYQTGDLTLRNFIYCNHAYRVNGEKIARYKYPWYNPRRYLECARARRFAALCDATGWPAYVAAILHARSKKDLLASHQQEDKTK